MQSNFIFVERASEYASSSGLFAEADQCTRRAILAFNLGPAVLSRPRQNFRLM
jgi:hypothetical protein